MYKWVTAALLLQLLLLLVGFVHPAPLLLTVKSFLGSTQEPQNAHNERHCQAQATDDVSTPQAHAHGVHQAVRFISDQRTCIEDLRKRCYISQFCSGGTCCVVKEITKFHKISCRGMKSNRFPSSASCIIIPSSACCTITQSSASCISDLELPNDENICTKITGTGKMWLYKYQTI